MGEKVAKTAIPVTPKIKLRTRNFTLSSQHSTHSCVSMQHPDFPEENDHLKSTIGVLNKKYSLSNPNDVAPDKYWEVYGGADEFTAMLFHSHAIDKWNRIARILNDAYFGRVDFAPTGSMAEIFYIGKQGFDIDGIQVIDWRAPISRLYYTKLSNEHNRTTYLSGGGQNSGNLLLKRHLSVKEQKLVEISDEVDWRNGPPEQKKIDVAETILAREIFSRGDPRLQDIVKTIQEHQDRIIRSPANQVVIINGVAGSGKTSIAYHRVAYLLFPDSQTNIQPRKTIVFNPNRLFLSYVKDLLPSLGVENVIQVSFDDWALKQMGLVTNINGKVKREVDIQDTALEVFLNKHSTREEQRSSWRRAQLKGGEKIKQLLMRYIEYRRQSFHIPNTGWEYDHLGKLDLTISLSKEEIQKLYTESLSNDWPLEKQRNHLINLLEETISSKFENAVEDAYQQKIITTDKSLFDNLRPSKGRIKKSAEDFRNRALSIPTNRTEVIRDARKRLRKDIDRTWKTVVRQDYYNFLGNRELLKQTGKGIIDDKEVDLLISLRLPNNTVDIEDIPALLYFYILARGKNNELYDHIVVDEAQDFSPLQYSLLRLFSSNSSMTISGDIAQGIYAHRGISDWDEITNTLDGMPFQIEEISQNYRATKEIVEFTNEVNRSVRKEKVNLAKPFNRTGIKPKIIHATNAEKMYEALDTDIKELIKKGIKNIGVIVKTSVECYEVSDSLKNNSYDVSVIPSRDTEYDYIGGVSILPVTLAKGMEFEAALVINVDNAAYDSNLQYDGRLLYVAVSRALHVLNVYYTGKVSSYLNTAIEKAIQVHV